MYENFYVLLIESNKRETTHNWVGAKLRFVCIKNI